MKRCMYLMMNKSGHYIATSNRLFISQCKRHGGRVFMVQPDTPVEHLVRWQVEGYRNTNRITEVTGAVRT